MKHHCQAFLLAVFLLMGLGVLAACQSAAPATPETTATVQDTPSPTVTASPTQSPTIFKPTSTITRTPTSTPIPLVLSPVKITTPLPGGLQMDIYAMNRLVEGQTIEYQEVFDLLKEKSHLNSLPTRTPQPEDWKLVEANAALKPFAYRLRPDEGKSYTLFSGDEVVLSNINRFSKVSVNRSKTDFVLVVRNDKTYLVVRRDSRQEWPPYDSLIMDAPPIFCGDVMMMVQRDENVPGLSFKVMAEGKQVFWAHSDVIHVRPGLVGFWTYGDHWAVEVLDGVSIDGEAMNERYGYQKSYEFHFLGEKPVFFFEKDGHAGVNFDRHEIILDGESIPHYGCCMNAMRNPYITSKVDGFFVNSPSGGYYVEMRTR